MKNNILQNNVIQYVNNIIELGLKYKSSDIHIKYNEDEVEIKYRINGHLMEIEELYEKIDRRNIAKNIIEIISRIKILSNMNVTEKRKPQDGSFSFFVMNDIKKENKFDIRVATLPVLNGESVVLRILKNFLNDIKLTTLGFSEKSVNLIKKMLERKYGIILVSGPTGSGKSTTLNSMINIINDGKKKIISVEDPVENKILGITQVQVNNEIGVNFGEILKSSLRNDPDVIVISEIRDEITAEIAIRAALTGHLVIATVHTNDTISSVIRLEDMKVPKYLILDSIIGVIGQRLVSTFDKKSRVIINEILYCDENIKKILKKSELNSKTKEMILNEQNNNYIDFQEDIKDKLEKEIIDKNDIYGVL